jgi:hypothetical protein
MDLDYIEHLLMILKELEYSDLTVQDLKDMHDEMLSIGLLPQENSMANFTMAVLESTGKYDFGGVSTAKYDHGFGINTKFWADKDDVFDVDFLVYNDVGEKLKLKSHKSGKMEVQEAVKEADRLKKEYDAYKVLVVERNTNKMLASLVTKGPAGKNLNINLDTAASTDDKLLSKRKENASMLAHKAGIRGPIGNWNSAGDELHTNLKNEVLTVKFVEGKPEITEIKLGDEQVWPFAPVERPHTKRFI